MNTFKQVVRIIRVYLRVSSMRQEKEETIKSQKGSVIRFIKNTFGPECEVQLFYEDDGYSGEFLERPFLAQMREDLTDDSWNTLVMYTPDRLSRDFNHGNMLTDEILSADKEIFYVEGPSPSKKSKLITRIMSAISDDDKEKILKKLYAGKLERAENNVINNSIAPYGYDLIPKNGSKSSAKFVQTHYLINEEEAQVVKMIFQWVAEDRLSVRQVVLKLKELGVRPRKSKRGVWNASTLNTLLKNETYIGKARFRSSYAVKPKRRLKPQQYPKMHKTSRCIRPKEEWMYIQGKSVPAILEGKQGITLFNKAQQQLKNNRRESTMGNKKQTAYMLGGRIRCACGYTRNRSGSQERKNIYYTCSSRKSCYPDKPCDLGGVSTRVADNKLWQKLSCMLTDPNELKKAIENYYSKNDFKGVTKAEQTVGVVKTQVEKLEKEKERMMTLYRRGIIEADELDAELKPIKGLLLSTRRKLESLESTSSKVTPQAIDPELFAKIICYAPDALKELSFEQKKEIVLDSVSNVVAVPGLMQVTGSVGVERGNLIYDSRNLKSKDNKAKMQSNYYVYLKTISRNCWSTQRWKINFI